MSEAHPPSATHQSWTGAVAVYLAKPPRAALYPGQAPPGASSSSAQAATLLPGASGAYDPELPPPHVDPQPAAAPETASAATVHPTRQQPSLLSAPAKAALRGTWLPSRGSATLTAVLSAAGHGEFTVKVQLESTTLWMQDLFSGGGEVRLIAPTMSPPAGQQEKQQQQQQPTATGGRGPVTDATAATKGPRAAASHELHPWLLLLLPPRPPPLASASAAAVISKAVVSSQGPPPAALGAVLERGYSGAEVAASSCPPALCFRFNSPGEGRAFRSLMEAAGRVKEAVVSRAEERRADLERRRAEAAARLQRRRELQLLEQQQQQRGRLQTLSRQQEAAAAAQRHSPAVCAHEAKRWACTDEKGPRPFSGFQEADTALSDRTIRHVGSDTAADTSQRKGSGEGSGDCGKVQIPIRPPQLPSVARVLLRAGGKAKISISPADVSIKLSQRDSLRFTTPRYTSPDGTTRGLQAPALILDAICSNFSIELTNNLPFQPFHTCPAGGDKIDNGPKDYQWTNLHTHGLKVDPGATSIDNICEPGFPNAGIADRTITIQEYYCNDTVSSQQFCRVRGDNVFVIDRPRTNATFLYNIRQHPAGATVRYTYPLEAIVPGVGWYHPHQHGSVAIQTPTSAAPLIVPESSLPGGVRELYVENGRGNKKECDRLVKILKEQPMESSTILQINGIWFRNTSTASGALIPDDDTIPFLGSAASPPSALLFDSSGKPLYKNAAGRDWGLVNGAFQPTVSLTEGRMLVVDSRTGGLTPVDTCKIWLLGRDAVPLPTVPRLLSSKPNGGSRFYNDVIMGPANRVDVVIKCDVPGKYVLASCAGPFRTNYDACRATHCECFGDRPANGALLRPANNLYGGFELDAAVLAVLDVHARPRDKKSEHDFANGVCKSRLEFFRYLDYQNFPKPATEQCISFMNQQFGGACTINNQLFPQGVGYVMQGSQQIWRLRDVTFHPFHLHETPVRLTKLPPCAAKVTNNWQDGDWLDSILLPPCQTGCPWPARGSGNGTCGDPVTVCDETTVQWLATNFDQVPAMALGTGGSNDLCSRKNGNSGMKPVALPDVCSERLSVFHCHVLPHEDEGCMALLVWFCPGFTPPSAAYPAQCPATYTNNCSPPSASRNGPPRRP
ncbi:hypothetical protein VOLCADRAFT_89596 [Volvox carteri f. nagariensis]|uniref:Plastocyanin-like domain-containing protein n=1 Tax=Volvox carteri f. nagariensis TaxID=3068 RepID=D8TS93_VOLCA|nr:uncharacterized protein VOLCADRAFT_89596 [Volvox carteri f. nagariensis]EFJ49786.1 hypothetical protein VOLCADRAFT_89596 [Volvox carteri f. nagariensis]|eukprot:XP_002949293.1 hypothetical protein VOLCADRAFT_89596 [Volvox carteri f. nagariensis]